MAYHGEVLTYCPADLDFSVIYAVIVSGDLPNPCGHALLFVPSVYAIFSSDGSYFQVAQMNGFPLILSTKGYLLYLRENKKKELTRYAVSLSDPGAAINRLEETMQKKWLWAVLPHNCAAFVEDICSAGGSSAGLYTNCPRWEKFK